MSKNTEALAQDRVGALILRFSIPSIAGMLVNGLYNVMDRVFVGRGVGSDALAGVAIVFPLVMLVMAIGMLAGLGASSLIALKLGAGKREEAEGIVGISTSLALLFGLATTLAVALFMRPIMLFFGGRGVILDYALTFTTAYLPGIFLQIMGFCLNNMIRGQGDPMTALLTMVISCGINCLLNPIFIFVFHWGIAGSAIATDISQLVTVAWLLIVYLSTKKGLRLRASAMPLRGAVVRDIMSIGMVPSFVQIATVATLILSNNLIASYGGSTGVAVMGIMTSLVNLMLMPIIGVNQGVQPILGFNYGAKLYPRVRKALRLSIIGVCLICSLAYLLFFIFSSQLISLFAPGAEGIISMGVQGLRLYLSSIPILGIIMLGTGYFQAVKKPMQALVPNILRQLVLLVPLMLILPRFLGLLGLWVAGPITDLVCTMTTLAFLLPEMRNLELQEQRLPYDSGSEPASGPGFAKAGPMVPKTLE